MPVPQLGIWKKLGINWYSFYLGKERVYKVVWKGTAGILMGLCAYQVAAMWYIWQHSVHRSWHHYAMKEKERRDLIELIRIGREEGRLPPSMEADFE